MTAPRTKPLIYVSGPMSGDFLTNCNRGIDEADSVFVLGAAIIVPHLWYWYDQRHKHPYEDLMQLDFEHIARCDALYIYASSPGANREAAFAEKHGVPVLRTLDEVKMFIAKWGVPRTESSLSPVTAAMEATSSRSAAIIQPPSTVSVHLMVCITMRPKGQSAIIPHWACDFIVTHDPSTIDQSAYSMIIEVARCAAPTLSAATAGISAIVTKFYPDIVNFVEMSTSDL